MDTARIDDLFERLGSPQRMRRLAGYDLFTSALTSRLDPICAHTAELLSTPVSMVSIVLDTAQFIIGAHGLHGWVAQAQGMPAEWSICSHTVIGGAPYCVADLTADPLHADNPLLMASGLRSYAGMPLIDSSGHVLGTHCVLDGVTRTFTEPDLTVLRAGADRAVEILAGMRPDD